MNEPKVAIIHDSLTQHGGAENTVEAMLEIFPNATVYTSVYKPAAMGKSFKDKAKKVVAGSNSFNSALGKFPILTKYFTFLLPLVFENFDLSAYDIVLSSSASYAKGVLTKPHQLHVAYIHTPPRFLYGYSVESTKRDAWYYKPVVMVVDHYLKIWDYLAAQRADFIVTNSKEVKRRVKKFYGRDATVINPPVESDYAEKKYPKDNMQQPYYIALGRLSHYKNFDLIVNAFNLVGLPLKIVGTGIEKDKLKKIAKDNIEFMGRVSDMEKHRLLQHSLGLIFPVKDEDYGITVIEALSHGKPVLAHKSGGPLEIIQDGKDGMFLDSLDLDSFVTKLKEFDEKIREKKSDGDSIKRRSKRFSKKRFQTELKNFVLEKWDEKKRAALSPINNA